MFQKCPICNGSGIISKQTFDTSSLTICTESCPTCFGTRIISQITGLPPAYQDNKSNFTSTDFRDNVETQEEYFGRK